LKTSESSGVFSRPPARPRRSADRPPRPTLGSPPHLRLVHYASCLAFRELIGHGGSEHPYPDVGSR
ncbi:MAG TPA: hypothetical protein PLC99_25605, partial [Verrucomicrobiota bacterium]|nr:hypothetical protein [Verrucomicrobiota bacterium]